jgi:hypothetical protein
VDRIEMILARHSHNQMPPEIAQIEQITAEKKWHSLR